MSPPSLVRDTLGAYTSIFVSKLTCLRKLDAEIGGLRISAEHWPDAEEDLEGGGTEEGALLTKHNLQRNVMERLLLNAK